MMKVFLSIVFSLVSLLNFSHYNTQKKFHLISVNGYAQGTTYTIKYISADTSITSNQIDSILKTIDSSLSHYKPYSLLSAFNQSQDCIKMDRHFKNVWSTSLNIAHSSKGAFDPTCKPLSELWGFGTNMNHSSTKPSQRQIHKILPLIGFEKLSIQHDSICKPIHSIKLDFDGIAQGYSVDVIAQYFISSGIDNFIIELGGEIYAHGTNDNEIPWAVGLEDPAAFFGKDFLIKKKIILKNAAITTSGNYRKFKKLGNQYFSHIIDPHLGKPVQNGIISVSVIAESAIVADGWDNAFMVMGIPKALAKADELNKTGVYILYQDKLGEIRDTCNTFFQHHLVYH